MGRGEKVIHEGIVLDNSKEHLGPGENFPKTGMLCACGVTERSLESR